jgi:hypothetical protein
LYRVINKFLIILFKVKELVRAGTRNKNRISADRPRRQLPIMQQGLFNLNNKRTQDLTEENKSSIRTLTHETVRQQRPGAGTHFQTSLEEVFTDKKITFILINQPQTDQLIGFLMYTLMGEKDIYIKGLLVNVEFERNSGISRWLLGTMMHLYAVVRVFSLTFKALIPFVWSVVYLKITQTPDYSRMSGW